VHKNRELSNSLSIVMLPVAFIQLVIRNGRVHRYFFPAPEAYKSAVENYSSTDKNSA
jgi:hypothetical protein